MGEPPLSGTMRIRLIIGAVSCALLVLVNLPLEVLAVVHHDSVGKSLPIFAIGLGLPAVYGSLMWWQVRRWRRTPERRRREPNKPAARIILFGTLAIGLVGYVALGAFGLGSWAGWVALLAVTALGSVVVYAIAKRKDPRLHYFRRPDPLPPGQEPEGPGRAPW